MRRVLFLGNGFDLAHGLPTKYCDFLYVCQRYIGNILEYKCDYLNVVEEALKMFQNKYGEKYKTIISNNVWIRHFVKRYKQIDENWIDFEKEIRTVCEERTAFITEPKNRAKILEKNKDFISFPKGEFDLKKMTTHLKELIDILNSYLLVVSGMNNGCYSEDILGFAPTDVISFNYTRTFEKKYNLQRRIDYVHGMISSANKPNSIVLGFNSFDNSEIDYDYAEYLKYFQMVNNDITIDILNSCEKDLTDVYSLFYGHSLDSTDEDIIKQAIKISNKVFIMYSTNNHKASMIKNLIKIYGETDFRELCLNTKKKIIFIKQKDMVNDFGPFTNDCITKYKNILSRSPNIEYYNNFVFNYFNNVNFGVIGSSEIYYSYYNLYKKNFISKENVFEILKNIKERIKYFYLINEISIKSQEDLFNDFEMYCKLQ